MCPQYQVHQSTRESCSVGSEEQTHSLWGSLHPRAKVEPQHPASALTTFSPSPLYFYCILTCSCLRMPSPTSPKIILCSELITIPLTSLSHQCHSLFHVPQQLCSHQWETLRFFSTAAVHSLETDCLVLPSRLIVELCLSVWVSIIEVICKCHFKKSWCRKSNLCRLLIHLNRLFERYSTHSLTPRPHRWTGSSVSTGLWLGRKELFLRFKVLLSTLTKCAEIIETFFFWKPLPTVEWPAPVLLRLVNKGKVNMAPTFLEMRFGLSFLPHTLGSESWTEFLSVWLLTSLTPAPTGVWFKWKVKQCFLRLILVLFLPHTLRGQSRTVLSNIA